MSETETEPHPAWRLVNKWTAAGAVGLIVYFEFFAEWPEIPHWFELVAMGAGVVIIGAYLASDQIEALLPDPPRVTLVEIDATETEVLRTWEVTPDTFAEIEVVAGRLNPLPGCLSETYECYHFDDESLVAVGTWRESLPDSQLVGHHKVTDALERIEDLQNHLEPMAREGRYLRQHLPGIVREIDAERMKAQNAALEPHVAPSFGERGLDEILESQLPDELRPDRLKDRDRGDGEDTAVESEGFVGFDILDESESIEPVGQTNGEET
jgi:hypothetical protein